MTKSDALIAITFIVMVLSFAQIAWNFETRDRIVELESENAAITALLEQMVENDESFVGALEANTRSIGINTTIAEALSLRALEHTKWATAAIAEIYQTQIIPLRAYHMSDP